MQEIADWLEKLGLGQYAQHFAENDITFAILPDLTDQDFIELGVASLGHRRQLLRAIAKQDRLEQGTPGTGIAPRDIAERRQVTVMFSDLVGSTALSARMDPEDLREVISAYQKCVAETVRRFDGFVAKYMGDGVLVYFGYPQAHEDDAERAVRAGLELIAAVGALKSAVQLQTRVGISTGLVVVGDLVGSGEAQELGIVGETPNLAARIQAAAAPDSLVVSEATWRLAGPAFEYEDLSLRELKGIPGTVRLWRVIGEGAARGRFDARLIRGLAPLVGRSEEIALLRHRWAYASDGDGQLVLLSAPAGVGKSRLTQAFRESLDEVRPTCLQLFGSPFHTNSAFYPFIRSLEWMSAIVRTDPPLRKLEKLEAVLRPAQAGDSDAVPLMAALLSIPFGERYPVLQINEQVQKQRTMEVIEQQVVQLTGIGPALILVEDAHWMDATSLQLLDRIIRRVVDLPVMIVVNFRPEFAPPWSELGHTTMLKLNHLSRRQVVDLIGKLTHGKALPEAIVEQIVGKAQGIPLFVEEITRSVLESGDLEESEGRYVLRHSVREFAIPPTLQDSLIARLDRLGAAKDVAFTAAIIGREFSYELIKAVSPLATEPLQEGLAHLVRSDLLGQRGTPPQAHYTFKHALIQDAAYQAVLKARRRELHRKIADILADRFPEVAESEPELLAHHYSEAGVPDRALEYWRVAAARGASGLAYVEALGHIAKAGTLIEGLPPGRERDEWELGFLVIEGPSRMALDGWDSRPAKLLYDKARATAERLGRPAEVFRSVWGLWMGAHSSGNHGKAREHLHEIFRLLPPDRCSRIHRAGAPCRRLANGGGGQARAGDDPCRPAAGELSDGRPRQPGADLWRA